MRPVPVLMYHHITPHRGDTVTVTPEVFDGQMRYLRESGYRTLSLDELYKYMAGELSIREKGVVVTFDDGWLDNYHYAYPVLRKYGIKAAVFIITGRTDAASERGSVTRGSFPSHGEAKSLITQGRAEEVVLDWDLVSAMANEGLVEFHSHTVTHRRCAELSSEDLESELNDSKHVLEAVLGWECPFLCWPYGSYNPAAVEAARKAGYKALMTVTPGVTLPGSDVWHIKRIVVKDSVPSFIVKMNIYSSRLLSSAYLRFKGR